MLLLLCLTIIFLTFASAQIDVKLCSDTQCKEEPLTTIRLDGPSGCRTDFAGKAQALEINPIQSDGSPEQAIRFYRSADCFAHCGTTHLISQMSGGWGFQSLRRGVSGAPIMQSFELVELDEEGKYPPHGYCGLRHGDAQFFRGRAWKWQQIGKAMFREVPLEEWDDEVHVRRTEGDYDMHGAVEASGKFKWQQISESGWRGVELEEWDDEVHLRGTEKLLGFAEHEDI